MTMECKDIKVKELKTKVWKTCFHVDISTSETRKELYDSIHVYSSREVKPKMAPNYYLDHDRVRREILPPKNVWLCG